MNEIQVHIIPSKENKHADTDVDSNNSDGPSGEPAKLPGKLLGGLGEAVNVKQRKRGNKYVYKSRKNNDIVWTKDNPGFAGSKVPRLLRHELSFENQEFLDSCSTAYDFYKVFQPDTFTEQVIFQSKLYAVQKGYAEKTIEIVDLDRVRCTEAFLLHSGYMHVPRRRMVWEQKEDCYCPFIADNVRRREIESVLQCLHFRDNTKQNDDVFFKVRPIFDNLNSGGKWFTDEGNYSVDEIMIPYFGNHSCKQFIRGKPVRFGYKVKVRMSFQVLKV